MPAFLPFRRLRWRCPVRAFMNGKLTPQAFANENADQFFYYTTPFFQDAQGTMQENALHRPACDTLYFPLFSSPEACRNYTRKRDAMDCIFIRGTLQDALNALDSHPLLASFGIVIDPNTKRSVCIPPLVRVQPKYLR